MQIKIKVKVRTVAGKEIGYEIHEVVSTEGHTITWPGIFTRAGAIREIQTVLKVKLNKAEINAIFKGASLESERL